MNIEPKDLNDLSLHELAELLIVKISDLLSAHTDNDEQKLQNLLSQVEYLLETIKSKRGNDF